MQRQAFQAILVMDIIQEHIKVAVPAVRLLDHATPSRNVAHYVLQLLAVCAADDFILHFEQLESVIV